MLKELLIKQISEDQAGIIDSLAFNPVDNHEKYLQLVGEIRGLQRVLRFLEDLPNE
ncbi:MAG: hypothetical protein ACR2PE_05160 [Porticoccus sp.]